MASNDEDDRDSREFFLRSRKEAIVAGAIWFVFFLWVIGVSYPMGYGDIDPADTVFGFPAWVFWGIFLPFVVATVLNSVFALVYLKDEDRKL